jgi:hypothetical protein
MTNRVFFGDTHLCKTNICVMKGVIFFNMEFGCTIASIFGCNFIFIFSILGTFFFPLELKYVGMNLEFFVA